MSLNQKKIFSVIAKNNGKIAALSPSKIEVTFLNQKDLSPSCGHSVEKSAFEKSFQKSSDKDKDICPICISLNSEKKDDKSKEKKKKKKKKNGLNTGFIGEKFDRSDLTDYELEFCSIEEVKKRTQKEMSFPLARINDIDQRTFKEIADKLNPLDLAGFIDSLIIQPGSRNRKDLLLSMKEYIGIAAWPIEMIVDWFNDSVFGGFYDNIRVLILTTLDFDFSSSFKLPKSLERLFRVTACTSFFWIENGSVSSILDFIHPENQGAPIDIVEYRYGWTQDSYDTKYFSDVDKNEISIYNKDTDSDLLNATTIKLVYYYMLNYNLNFFYVGNTLVESGQQMTPFYEAFVNVSIYCPKFRETLFLERGNQEEYEFHRKLYPYPVKVSGLTINKELKSLWMSQTKSNFLILTPQHYQLYNIFKFQYFMSRYNNASNTIRYNSIDEHSPQIPIFLEYNKIKHLSLTEAEISELNYTEEEWKTHVSEFSMRNKLFDFCKKYFETDFKKVYRRLDNIVSMFTDGIEYDIESMTLSIFGENGDVISDYRKQQIKEIAEINGYNYSLNEFGRFNKNITITKRGSSKQKNQN